jgi:hypothetical protein
MHLNVAISGPTLVSSPWPFVGHRKMTVTAGRHLPLGFVGGANTSAWNSEETAARAYWLKSSSSLRFYFWGRKAIVTVLKWRQKQTSFRNDCCILGPSSVCWQPQVNHRALVPILKPPRPFIPWEEIAHRCEESSEKEAGGGEQVEWGALFCSYWKKKISLKERDFTKDTGILVRLLVALP